MTETEKFSEALKKFKKSLRDVDFFGEEAYAALQKLVSLLEEVKNANR